jgi:hypothetical protein
MVKAAGCSSVTAAMALLMRSVKAARAVPPAGGATAAMVVQAALTQSLVPVATAARVAPAGCSSVTVVPVVLAVTPLVPARLAATVVLAAASEFWTPGATVVTAAMAATARTGLPELTTVRSRVLLAATAKLAVTADKAVPVATAGGGSAMAVTAGTVGLPAMAVPAAPAEPTRSVG